MCGIAGIITPNPSNITTTVLQRMAKVLAHRGPDGERLWINEKQTVGFSHRRLSIIDLSERGAQPMHYLNRYTIVYNGEIYNYLELKTDLEKSGYVFTTKSDTEVILAAYDFYEERCLQYFDGMFSFAIWDEETQILFAARDRFGEKPFYYHKTDEAFLFASEMKGLWAAGIEKYADEKMLLNFISLGYVQNPADKSQTFFKNIYSLPPAHFILYNLHTGRLAIRSYWDIDKGVTEQYELEEALYKLNALFSASISKRLRSDVSIATSLSGGLDSSSILSFILQEQKNKSFSFKTFSAVFPGFQKDESYFINKTIESTGCHNYQVNPTADSLVMEFEKLAYHQEEPFPSSSIYAQYKVFEVAKENNIKVLLDGQGADEILAGYHHYGHWFLQELASRYNYKVWREQKTALNKNNVQPGWGFKNILATLLPSHAALVLEKRELKKTRDNKNITPAFLALIQDTGWESKNKPVIKKLNDILYFNTMQYGLETLLRYADRNSMAHGTEVRLPFLNAELVQFIFSLPSTLKIKNGYPKWILRKLMEKRLPAEIVWRKDKIGYEPPQKSWMHTETLTDYIHEAKKKLVSKNILRPSTLNNKTVPLDAHSADNYDWRYLSAAQII
ncbi:MAG: asparagine synthase (glutamine-hydrolyzing) [Ferruginibacter sp.]